LGEHPNHLLRHTRVQNLRNHKPGNRDRYHPAHPHHLLVLPERFNDCLSIRLHPKLDQFRQKLERGGMKTIITRQEYSRIFECNERTARRDLADLEMKNVIVMGKSGATKLFRLNAVFSTYVDMGGLGGR